MGTNPLVQGLGSRIHLAIYQVQSREALCLKIVSLYAQLKRASGELRERAITLFLTNLIHHVEICYLSGPTQ